MLKHTKWRAVQPIVRSEQITRVRTRLGAPFFFTCEYLQFSEIRGRKTVCGPDCKERTQGRFIEMGVRCVLEVSLLAALETVHERRYAPHLAVWAWGRPLLGPCMHKSFRTP